MKNSHVSDGSRYYVYIIKNLINSKYYVGITKNPKKRWLDHKWLANQDPSNEDRSLIHKAIFKYGSSNFKFQIIENCSNINKASIREAEWIAILKLQNCQIYNLTDGGLGAPKRILSKTTLDKMKASKGGEKNGKCCKLTQKKVNEIRSYLNDKNTTMKISERIKFLSDKYKISACSIREIKRNLTWVDDQLPIDSRVKNNHISDSTRSKIIELYFLQKLKTNKISEDLSISIDQVRMAIKREKIDKNIPIVKFNKISTEKRLQIKEAISLGILTIEEMADKFKVHGTTIRSIKNKI